MLGFREGAELLGGYFHGYHLRTKRKTEEDALINIFFYL